MTNPVKLLSDDEIAEIEAETRAERVRYYPTRYKAFDHIDALCQTVRVLRQQIAELITEWCECGHAKTQHGFFSDHDECYECDQMSDDLCCEWRPAPRETDTYTALREQLAHWQERTRERTTEVERLQAQLAQVTQERDELRTQTQLKG